MKSVWYVAAMVMTPVCLGAQSASELSDDAREFVSVDAPVVALVGVQLVDGTGAPAKPGQTIVIDNGRIAAVGDNVAIPEDARRIDLEGHTVIPGIVGVHNHTFYTTSRRQSQMNTTAPRLYLASGVTTIRTKSLVEYHSMSFTLLGQGEPERVSTGVVSAEFFDVLGVKLQLGRTFVAADERHGAEAVLVLSHGYWQRSFGGDREIVGQVFEMNDRPHTVVGVLPPIPQFPNEHDVYMPSVACPFRAAG